MCFQAKQAKSRIKERSDYQADSCKTSPISELCRRKEGKAKGRDEGRERRKKGKREGVRVGGREAKKEGNSSQEFLRFV